MSRAKNIIDGMNEMARKVTDDVVAAFKARKKKKVGKTHTDGNAFYLHGNRIAEIRGNELWITNAGWGTVTTRERLNGILQGFGTGMSVSQKKRLQMLDGKEWDGDWTKVGTV